MCTLHSVCCRCEFWYSVQSIQCLPYILFVVGVGFGIVYSLSSVYPAFIFTKHRVLALGVASAGVGVGNLIFPPLLQLLIEQQGWRSAMVWCSALTLQVCSSLSAVIPGALEITLNYFC